MGTENVKRFGFPPRRGMSRTSIAHPPDWPNRERGSRLSGLLWRPALTSCQSRSSRTCPPPALPAPAPRRDGDCGGLLLQWVNHADLYRLKGVGSEYADLLEAAGVDSCPELARRNAANLAAKLVEVNDAKSLVRRVPTEAMVAAWIEQAKGLPKVVTH